VQPVKNPHIPNRFAIRQVKNGFVRNAKNDLKKYLTVCRTGKAALFVLNAKRKTKENAVFPIITGKGW